MKMIKKLMMLCVAAMAATGAWSATCVTNGIAWTYIVRDGVASLENGSSSVISASTVGSIEIPSTLEGYPVEIIGSYAFKDCFNVTNIVVSSMVTNIGTYAFQNCRGLKELVVPDNVLHIDYGAFNGCDGLERLTIPFVGKRRSNNSSEALFGYMFGSTSSPGSRRVAQSYGSSSYYYIPTNLTEVVVTDESHLSYGAFYGCVDLKSVTLNEGLSDIDSSVFYGCSGLEWLDFPDTVKSIGSSAFYGCTKLSSEVFSSLPSNLKSIGSYAFNGCNIASGDIIIPEGVEIIGSYAFKDCFNVTNIVVSSTVTNIGTYAFQNCRGLKELVVPDNVLHIDYGAFNGCDGLERLTIPFVGKRRSNNSSEALFGYMFGSTSSPGSRRVAQSYGSSSYYYIPTNLTEVVVTDESHLSYGAFYGCVDLKSVTLNEGVEEIGDRTFYGCLSLQTVIIPESVNTISSLAFNGCDNLVYDTNTVLGVKMLGKWVAGYTDKLPSHLDLTGAKGFIGENVFTECSAIESLTIPASIAQIPDNAFKGCTNLLSLVLLEGVNSIGNYAFAECSKLNSVQIPQSLTYSGNRAFENCNAIKVVNVVDLTAYMNIDFGSGSGNPAMYANSLLVGGELLENLVVPEAVTNIKNHTFYYNYALKSVTMHDNVVNVEKSAFCNCEGLTNVVFSAGLTNLTLYAFHECTNITQIVLNEGLKSIGDYVFQGCSSLRMVSFPSTVETVGVDVFTQCRDLKATFAENTIRIPDGTFSGCPGLVFVDVPDSVTDIGARAFDGCSKLAAFKFPSSLENIGSYAFRGCSGIAELNLPSSLQTIGIGAFSQCGGLSEVVIPPSVHMLASDSFARCGKITNIVFSAGVTNIAVRAFEECSKLVSLKLPEGLETIGDNAFENCKKLETVYIPSTLRHSGAQAFNGCTALREVNAADLTAWLNIKFGDGAGNPIKFSHSLWIDGEELTDLVVPESVTSIRNHAFYYDYSLRSVTMHDGVTNIEKSAFCYCNGITNIVFSRGLESIGMYAFNGCAGLTEADLPEGVVEIKQYAFKDCPGLTTVKIPSTVEYIGADAFAGSGPLNVRLGNGMTEICDNAFSNCTTLVGIAIPSTVTNIGNAAFWNCIGLTELGLPTELYRIGSDAFGRCSGLGDIVVPANVAVISARAFSGCGNVSNVTIHSRLETVGDSAFLSCTNIHSVCVSELRPWFSIAFGNATANPLYYARALTVDGEILRNIVVPSDVVSIGQYVFENCVGITNVVIPASVENLHKTAFTGCSGVLTATVPSDRYPMGVLFDAAYTNTLKSVIVSDGSKFICADAFRDCAKLESVTIPASVRSVQSSAFYGCTSLSEIQLPSSVTAVAPDAFLGCSSLSEISVEGNNEHLKTVDGVLFAKLASTNASDGVTAILCHPPCKSGASYSIPDVVSVVGEYAFHGCNSLREIVVPSKVEEIPITAFDTCQKLEKIDISEDNAFFKDVDGVVFSKDGKSLVFYPRGKKGNYIVPDGVESIGAFAFANCEGLTGVAFPDSVLIVGVNAFDGCIALSDVELNDALSEISAYAFRNCRALTSIHIPEFLAKLGKGAFFGCVSLSNLVLPEGVQFDPVTLSGTISASTELERGHIYHIVNNLTISKGVTVDIPSGVVLKMGPGVSITVNGTLNAHGTRSAPVVFTSIKDDEYGGDTNGDGNNTYAQAGDWRYIWVYGMAHLEYAQVFYGGKADGSYGERGPLMTGGSGCLSMNGCMVAHSLYDGIWNWGGSIAVTNTVITETGWATAPYRGARNEYVNCVFYNNNSMSCYWSHWSGKPVYRNCIFMNCSKGWCERESGLYGAPPSAVGVYNCLFWNAPEFEAQSCIRVGSDGNIWGNPRFVDPEIGDFRIESASLCVDAGDGTVAPERDYFGQMRQTIYADAAGVPTVGGKYPDIGIHEVMPRNVDVDVDMSVENIIVPEVLIVGETVDVSWTVKNIGSETSDGIRYDAVDLVCANGSIVRLGTVTADAAIPVGGSRIVSGRWVVPSAQVGSVRIRVTVNANRDIFEGTLTSNNSIESGLVTLTMPELEFSEGDVASLSLPAGHSTGYRLGSNMKGGGLLIVNVTSGNLKVWTGSGYVPTADIFYSSAVKINDGTYIVRVPAGADAYVAFANNGNGVVKADVGFEAGGFTLFDTGVVNAPNTGLVSLPLFGNGFESSMDVWLVGRGVGSAQHIPVSELVVFDPVKAVARFDVTGLGAGEYEVHVKKGDEEISSVVLSLTETRVGPKWSCRLDIANAVRSSREYVGYLEYSNTGDMPLDAPYVKLSADSGSMIRFGKSDAWGDTLELMATSETYPASQLKPGETRRIPFRYKTTGSSLSIECGYTQDDPSAFPWDTNAAYMRPSWASDELWGLSLAVLKSNVGATWNDYLARMRANCDHLAKIGQPTYRLDRIWQLEINEALGVDHAVSTLASNTDLARSGRGFGLALSRSYGSGLYRRLRKGIFGYGWSDNYSAYAELQNSGATLALHSGSGSTYLFEKVNGKWTPEDARDKTTCTESSSEYVLTYRSGTVQRIAKSNMRVSSVTDNQGNSITFTYNADKQLVKVEHCDGQSFSFTYAGGLLASATDDQGRTTRYEYSGDLLVKVTAFNGLSTQYRYLPADGFVTSRALSQIRYADGTTRDYTYDGAGRVATVSINGNLQTVEIERGALGSYSVGAPNGGATTVTLGASGEVLETVNALGQKSTRTYTADSLLESVVGPTGKRVKIAYDADGQAVKATDAAGADTHFGYTSDFGNLAKVTDARGNSFDYGYDKKGRFKSISYADGSIEFIAYNDRGDVTNSVNRRGQSIAFTYDREGNTLSKVWEDGRTFTWAYDAKGNCTNATDSATGTVTMEYDENERLTRIVHPKGRGFAYTYDALGRTTSRTTLTGGLPFSATAADIQRYEYDALGRLARMTDGDGNLYVENHYDETTGWLITQTYGNGTVVSNAYDILGRTIGIYHFKTDQTSQTLAFFEYAYDAEGRRISQTTAEGVERYTYDTIGQLTDVIYPDSSEEHFTYDAVGNRISRTGCQPVQEETYTANNLNQYTEIVNAQAARSTMEYDLDGNMTRKGDTRYYYDIQNRLVAVTNTTKDIAWSCEYDVFGNRTKVIDHGTVKETLFVQGSLASAVADYDASGSPTTRHILLGSVRIADITRTTGGSPVETRYYHADGLASTRLLTDANGDTIGTASYRAFGEVRMGGSPSSATAPAPSAGWVGTLGVERDDATGLVFMRNRYYDAEQGRFMQMDPIGFVASDVNLCRYCKNSPVVSTDINGMIDELTCRAMFTTGGAASGTSAGYLFGVLTVGASAVPTGGGTLALSPLYIPATTAAGGIAGTYIGNGLGTVVCPMYSSSGINGVGGSSGSGYTPQNNQNGQQQGNQNNKDPQKKPPKKTEDESIFPPGTLNKSGDGKVLRPGGEYSGGNTLGQG